MKNLLIIALFLFVILGLNAQDSKYSNFEPTVFPDRIMLSIPGNPATTRSVSWRTVFDVTKSFSEIAILDPSPKFEDKVVQVSGTNTSWEEGSQSAMGHKVIFENLQPKTKYAYRVGDGENWSEWVQFETSSAENEPFSFIYLGDVQNDIKSLGSRTLRQAYTHFPDADFMLFAGDLVSKSNEDYWREFFYAGGWIFGMTPSIVTPGNHEFDSNENGPRTFSKHWNQIYQMPPTSPSEKYNNRNYFIDYQGVRFVSFDSPSLGYYAEDTTLILNWLEKTLSENQNRWTVVFTHYPIYSCSQGRNNERYRNAVQPLLEKYNVDLVLAGHDHTYCRGFNTENIMVKGKNAPLYVVSVSGPKMYGLNTSFWGDHMGSMTQLYQHISIDGDKLDFKSFTVAGELYDHFVITKNENGVNTFTEGIEVESIIQRTTIPESALEKYTPQELDIYKENFPEK
ncbi:MAG: metallophosphoesterase family protein [Prolixibacteraceae bacterium]|nr:metallophosphoesterase family protein [Prolixibacteraceae bacterium]